MYSEPRIIFCCRFDRGHLRICRSSHVISEFTSKNSTMEVINSDLELRAQSKGGRTEVSLGFSLQVALPMFLSFKLNIDYDEEMRSPKNVTFIQKELEKCFECEAVQLVDVRNGCVTLDFMIPRPFVSYRFQKAMDEQEKSFYLDWIDGSRKIVDEVGVSFLGKMEYRSNVLDWYPLISKLTSSSPMSLSGSESIESQKELTYEEKLCLLRKNQPSRKYYPLTAFERDDDEA